MFKEKQLTIFCREYSFVANGALRKCHNIVYILWRRNPRFLSLFVEPQIRSGTINQSSRIDRLLPILGNFFRSSGRLGQGDTYLKPGPVMSGQPVMVQNSDIVPYTRLIWSNNARVCDANHSL